MEPPAFSPAMPPARDWAFLEVETLPCERIHQGTGEAAFDGSLVIAYQPPGPGEDIVVGVVIEVRVDIPSNQDAADRAAGGEVTRYGARVGLKRKVARNTDGHVGVFHSEVVDDGAAAELGEEAGIGTWFDTEPLILTYRLLMS